MVICARNRRAKAAGVIESGVVKQRGARVVLFRGKETHTRSVLKAVSWRILGTLDTFVISWWLTGQVTMAGSIAALEFLTKIACYYSHVLVGASISWGRRSH